MEVIDRTERIRSLRERLDGADVPGAIYSLVEELYPICRSITGNGVRETLAILGEFIPLEIHEVPSGTRVFDWTVPREWNIRDAYIKDSQGRRVLDFQDSNLHVVGYSQPVNRKVSLEELWTHLYTLPEHPDWIPYRTSYYSESWGFCMAHSAAEKLKEDEYEVCIDSTLTEGHMTYGELLIPGASSEEVLFSSHVCHPAMCNDNLAAVAIMAALARELRGRQNRHTYRFLFIPATIGAIAWLSANRDKTRNIRHGLVGACLGDSGSFHYKKSRRGNAEIDRIVSHVLAASGDPYEILDYVPYGYDERQFCSPGFNLPMGCIMRTPHGRFPEYHTSADNLDFVQPAALGDSFSMIRQVIDLIEGNRYYLNTNPLCEPQLGKRGVYSHLDGPDRLTQQRSLFWVLSFSDGEHSLLDIAERSKVRFDFIRRAADLLVRVGLLIEQPRTQ